MHSTETETQPSDEGSNDDSESLDATQVNMGRSYELTSAEVYYLNQKEKQAQQLTCVGTVCVKGHLQRNTQTLFDVCSSDNWILDSFAKEIKAKEIGKFNGMVTTIMGAKKCILPKYSISLKKDKAIGRK